MNRILIALIITGCVVGYSWAASVTTTDGKIFNVTNDVGVTAPYSMDLINSYVSSSNQQVIRDQQTLVVDSEVDYTWIGIQQMAVNAYSQWQNPPVVNNSDVILDVQGTVQPI